jgi:hypothetical protein
MNAKNTILILLLVIPGLFFLFLKFFGTNTFIVPIYYEDGVSSTYCDLKIDTTYLLPDKEVTIYYAHTKNNMYLDRILYVLPRVQFNEDIRIVGLENLNEDPLSHVDQVDYEGLLPNMLVDYLSCRLLVYEQSSDIYNFIVLVDEKGRIRGYFDGSDEKELDRLLAELKVLKAA